MHQPISPWTHESIFRVGKLTAEAKISVKGFIATEIGGSVVLYGVRSADPLSIQKILSYPRERALRDSVAGRYSRAELHDHHRRAALKILNDTCKKARTRIDALIGRSERFFVPDHVAIVANPTVAVEVVYGKRVITFFYDPETKGLLEDSLEAEAYGERTSRPKVRITGETITCEKLTDAHREAGRKWAATLVERDPPSLTGLRGPGTRSARLSIGPQASLL